MFEKAGGFRNSRQVYNRVFRRAFAGWMHHTLMWAEMWQDGALTAKWLFRFGLLNSWKSLCPLWRQDTAHHIT